jgi:hypothetical protein
MPTIIELASIIDYSVTNPAINASVFPGTVLGQYFSASSYMGSIYWGWVVNFAFGRIEAQAPGSVWVRCVR